MKEALQCSRQRPQLVYLLLVLGCYLLHTSLAVGMPFQSETLEEYRYELSVLSRPVSSNITINGFHFIANVHLCSHWSNGKEKLISIKFNDVSTKSASSSKMSKTTAVSNEMMLIKWDNGHVKNLYVSKSDDKTSINLKKGIAAIIQYQQEDSIAEEMTPVGLCEVKYEAANEIEHVTIKKHINKCIPNVEYKHPITLLDTTRHYDYVAEYKIRNSEDKATIESVRSNEQFIMSVNAKSSLSLGIQSRQIFEFTQTSSCNSVSGSNFDEALQSIVQQENGKFSLESFHTNIPQQQCGAQCIPLSEAIKNVRSSLRSEELSTEKSAGAFLRVLPVVRSSSRQHILEMLLDTKNREILPQILDLLAAAQTPAAREAAFEYLDFKQKSDVIDLPERYLLAASYSTHPTIDTISTFVDLLDRPKEIRNAKLKQTILATIGSMIRTYCSDLERSCDNDLEVKAFSDTLVKQLGGCDDSECECTYLLGLSNTRLASLLPTYLYYAERGRDTHVALNALYGLMRLPPSHIDAQVHEVLLRIYKELKHSYDQTLRTTSVIIMLKTNPTRQTVTTILQSLTEEPYKEMTTFIWEQMKNIMQEHEYLRQLVKSILRGTKYGNYDTLARGGLSGATTNSLAETKDALINYGMFLELGKGGAFKRSSIDVDLHRSKDSLHVFTVGLFASGLESFTSDEESGGGGAASDGEQPVEEDPTAGMALKVFDANSRPLTFFTGQSELMGAVWSGSGSEPVSALQANLLLQDRSETITLQSGVGFQLDLRGVISLDLTGQIEISLWYRSTQSVVKTKGSIIIEMSLKMSNKIVKNEVQCSGSASAVIDFSTDVDFSDKPLKLCMVMSQPPFIYNEVHQRKERFAGSSKVTGQTLRRRSRHDGTCFYLHPKISDLCREMEQRPE